MTRTSLSATLAVTLGAAALAAVAIGVVGIHLGALSPARGFRIAAMVGAPVGLLALVMGVVGLIQTRSGVELDGRTRTWIGISLGALAVVPMLAGLATSPGTAMIHDVTTDFEDPPQFSEAVRNAPDRQNGIDYPDGGDVVPETQRTTYPDIEPIAISIPPDEALARAERASRSLGWTVTRVEPGRIEAYETTRIFRFVDDVVIRVRPRGDGSVVDVRSNSRVGGSDLGANAARIRVLRERLQAPAVSSRGASD